MRTGIIAATLAVGAVLGTALPALAGSSSASVTVTTTVAATCQDFQRPDGSHVTACNTTGPLVAPAGAKPVGGRYAASADGTAPLVIYSADGRSREVIY